MLRGNLRASKYNNLFYKWRSWDLEIENGEPGLKTEDFEI